MAILRKRALVHREDLIQAFHRWMHVTDYTNTFDLEDFLEHPNIFHRLADTREYMDVPEATKHKVDVLLGPHYRVMIKAWQAQRLP